MAVKKRAGELRKPTWYRMVSMFDGAAKRIAVLGKGGEALLRGVRYSAKVVCGKCGHTIDMNSLRVKGGVEDRLELSPELAVCTIPTSVTESQGEALRRMLEGNLRMPVLLISDNIHLVQLKPIITKIAKTIMDEAADEETRQLAASEPKLITPVVETEGPREDEGPETGGGGEAVVPEG